MKFKSNKNPRIRAEQWAYEFHPQVMRQLPPQIRHNIDWDLVAEDLESESPEEVPPEIKESIRRLVVCHEELADVVPPVVEGWGGGD